MEQILKESGAEVQVTGTGSLACVFFTGEPVKDYASAKKSDTSRFGRYFHYLLGHGIHAAPSQFEAVFFSNAHTEEDISAFLGAAKAFLKENEPRY